MPEVRHGNATWPGAIAVDSCTYTCSHGISPGIAILKILPQDGFVAEYGDLVIEDGVGRVTLKGCRVKSMIVEMNGGQRLWSIAIEDRRWRWVDLGAVAGCYDQPDPHSKLIPWTIQSPLELARLCLAAMGETRFTIDLPPGLTHAMGVMHGQLNPPHIGVVPITGTNPPINWEWEVPAQALANLCEQFGRKVIYRISDDSVVIAVPGRGADLPDGSLSSESPSIDKPKTPAGYAIVGDPTKFQARFDFSEAVGEEWDGSYVPIERLSYAPLINGAVQINTGTITATTTSLFRCYINAADNDPPQLGVLFETTTNDADTAAANLAAAINASMHIRIRGVVRASATDNVLTVQGIREGFVFSFICYPPGAGSSFVADMAQAAADPLGGWELSTPPLFPGVRRTDRLTLEEARGLAQKSVYKCYRLTTTSPTGQGPLIVPGFGRVDRRQQIVLIDTQVEQVVPVPLDRRLVNPRLAALDENAPGNAAVNINFYNGYSRDKPAAMYGRISTQVARNAGHVFFAPNDAENTTRNQQIFVSFKIKAVEQIVEFDDHVYCTRGALSLNCRYFPIDRPVLQTGCNVREAESGAFRCGVLTSTAQGRLDNSGTVDLTGFAVRHPEGVQLNLIGLYNADGSVAGARALEADAHNRASYYLAGLMAQYITGAALTRTYNGIQAIDCDGAIAQVSYSIGPGGAMTTASQNTEHSLYVPPYPARRRAEFLQPVQMRALGADPRLGANILRGNA